MVRGFGGEVHQVALDLLPLFLGCLVVQLVEIVVVELRRHRGGDGQQVSRPGLPAPELNPFLPEAGFEALAPPFDGAVDGFG